MDLLCPQGRAAERTRKAGLHLREESGTRIAGTIVEGAEDSATQKIARLQEAGIPVVERIDEIPGAVKEKLGVKA